MQITNSLTKLPQTYKGQQKGKQRPNFKGNLIINVMDAIEKGGLFASFTVQDMLGTNLPRPIAGLTRNKKENGGKSNKAMALKELIREMTTGPSMFLIPMGMIYGAKKLIGQSLNTPSEYIKGLGDIFKNTITEFKEIPADNVLKKKYIQNVFTNMLTSSTGKNKEELSGVIKEMTQSFLSLGKKDKKGLEVLENKFIGLVKGSSSNASADFLSASIKNNSGKISNRSFKQMLSFISDFTDDALKSTKKLSESVSIDKIPEAISNFTNKRIIQRSVLNIGMIGAIISFLCIIPKLYNSVSKEDPGLAGLSADEKSTTTTEVESLPQKENAQKKGEKNASKQA